MRIHSLALATALLIPFFNNAFAGDVAPPIEACVVNHEKFSEHDKAPITVEYNGRKMQVCCNHCVRKFKKDPAKFIKAWDDAVKASGKKDPNLAAAAR